AGVEAGAGAFRRNLEMARDIAPREREVELRDRGQVEAEGEGVVVGIVVDRENALRRDVSVLEEDAGVLVPPGNAGALLVGRVVATLGGDPGRDGTVAARREELDDARHGVRAVQGALRSPDDLHAA